MINIWTFCFFQTFHFIPQIRTKDYATQMCWLYLCIYLCLICLSPLPSAHIIYKLFSGNKKYFKNIKIFKYTCSSYYMTSFKCIRSIHCYMFQLKHYEFMCSRYPTFLTILIALSCDLHSDCKVFLYVCYLNIHSVNK